LIGAASENKAVVVILQITTTAFSMPAAFCGLSAVQLKSQLGEGFD